MEVESIATLLREQSDEVGVTLAVPADTAALTLFSLGIGLGFQRAIDTTIPVEPLVDLLRLVMNK